MLLVVVNTMELIVSNGSSFIELVTSIVRKFKNNTITNQEQNSNMVQNNKNDEEIKTENVINDAKPYGT